MKFGGVNGKLASNNFFWKLIWCAEGENDERGHSKSTFAQDSRVLTTPPPCPSPLFALVHFRAPPPLLPPKVRLFWLELTLSHSISIIVKFKEKKLIMSTSVCLNSTCLSRSHNGNSIKWTPLVHDKNVRFIQSPSKNQKSSKVNMKSTICHDFPSSDLLEGPKDGKIKENAKFFSF